MSINEGLPPQNIEAEQAVLGGILIDAAALDAVMTIIQPEDFYREVNRWIYDAYLVLHRQHEPIDFLTVSTVLEQQQRLADIGGAAALVKLIEVVPTAAHAEYYARLVAHCALQRRVIHAAGEVAAMAYDEPVPGELERQALALLQNATATSTVQHVLSPAERAEQFYNQITARRDFFVPSGFWAIDDGIGGWLRGGVTAILGIPAIGKSALCESSARLMSARGVKSLYVSAEMPAWLCTARELAARSGLNSLDMLRRTLNDEQMARAIAGLGEVSEGGIYVYDRPPFSPALIEAQVRRLWARGIDIQVIFVDSLQLLNSDNPQLRDVRHVVEDVSRALHLMAQSLDVPVVAVVKTNRKAYETNDHRPRKEYMRESGNLEYDASNVFAIHRPSMWGEDGQAVLMERTWQAVYRDGMEYAAHMTELLVLKGRVGGEGTPAEPYYIPLGWDSVHTRFWCPPRPLLP